MEEPPRGSPSCILTLSLHCPRWLEVPCPQSTGAAAETGAHPVPKPHAPAPSALYGLVHKPSFCSGKVQLMNFTPKVWATGLGGKGES